MKSTDSVGFKSDLKCQEFKYVVDYDYSSHVRPIKLDKVTIDIVVVETVNTPAQSDGHTFNHLGDYDTHVKTNDSLLRAANSPWRANTSCQGAKICFGEENSPFKEQVIQKCNKQM